MTQASLLLAAAVVALAVAGVHARRRAALKLPRVSRRWRRELRVAATVARECGLAILDATARKEAGLAAGGVDWKDAGGIDPCTQTDRDNEARVERALRTAFPAHAIIGEEAAAAAGAIPPLGDGPTWIVDPIDGTQNFVHGLPLSVVSVGLCVARAPALGVVYNPHTDELFVGVAGEGAWRNGARIACDARARDLSRALVLIDPGYERSALGVRRLAAKYLRLLRANTRAVRCLGSSVYSLVLVACGRASGFVIGLGDGDSPKPWDWCAAAVIAREAGATLRMLDQRRSPPGDEARPAGEGESFDLYSRSCVCAGAPELADELQRLALEAMAQPVN